jgi:phosphoesterase RecJ-like protein
MQSLSQLGNLIKGSKKLKVVITTHQKPDADALGSSLALFNYLRKYNHEVSVITPTDYPRFIHWMTGNNCVINFEENEQNKTKSTQLIYEADIIFLLDFSNYERIGDLAPLVEKSKSQKVLVDHHLSPTIKGDFELWNPKAAATCELVYELICNDFADREKIDIPIGECIYAGIMTDTGSFRFPTTTKKIHLIIADLIEIGVDNSKIHRLVYDNNSEERLRFIGFVLNQKLFIDKKNHTAYIVITKEELKQFHSQTGDTEGLVNYALSIEGICFASIIIERDDMVKLSFRSSGDFSVSDFANKHFEGGGHKNAAGGKSSLSLPETVEKFLALLKLYEKELQKEFNIKTELIPC